MSHVVEITVISGEELLINKKQRVKKNAFVIVRTDACNTQQTKMDKDGGSYPTWNEKLVVDLPMNARHLAVEVHCKTQTGNKVIGIAKIPTSDFLGGYMPLGYLHFLSYRLRDVYGQRNGIINLSVRVKTGENGGCAANYSWPWPAAPVGDGLPNGIATGVPIVYRY